MTVAVVVFPGTNCEHDVVHALGVLGVSAELVWHRETDLTGASAVVLPGGFAHGDYLRTGAIARFSPVMAEVARLASAGRPVLGICNGFQILCEAGMLPGVLLRNDHLQFRCDWQWLRVERAAGAWLADGEAPAGSVIRLPISHGEGRYHADADVLEELEHEGQVVLRYADADGRVVPDANPNGSVNAIAGIVNRRGNVLGLMPHPERAAEDEVGGTDGLRLLRSLDHWLAAQPAAAERRL